MHCLCQSEGHERLLRSPEGLEAGDGGRGLLDVDVVALYQEGPPQGGFMIGLNFE